MQGASFLTFIESDGLNNFFQVEILFFDDFLEFVVFSKDLLAYGDSVGELVFEDRELFAEEIVFLFESVQDGAEFSVKGEKAIKGVDLVVDDFIAVGSFVLGELPFEFVDDLIQRVGLGAGVYFLEQLSGIEFVFDFGYFFVMRTDHFF